MNGLRVVGAFLVRDWRLHAANRMGVLISLGSALATLTPFFFISQLVTTSLPQALAPYGGNYFAFVLMGLAAARYVSATLTGFAGRIREEQVNGTLEALMASPAPLWSILVGALAWEVLWTTAEVGLYVLLGITIFGVNLSSVNVLSVAALLAIGLTALSALGLLAACGVLLYKEADPVGWVLGSAMKVLGGVLFPVSLLPWWLERLAGALPLTPFLEGLRQAALLGKSPGALKANLLTLGIWIIVLWPMAIFSFHRTVRYLKQTGKLGFS